MIQTVIAVYSHFPKGNSIGGNFFFAEMQCQNNYLNCRKQRKSLNFILHLNLKTAVKWTK